MEFVQVAIAHMQHLSAGIVAALNESRVSRTCDLRSVGAGMTGAVGRSRSLAGRLAVRAERPLKTVRDTPKASRRSTSHSWLSVRPGSAHQDMLVRSAQAGIARPAAPNAVSNAVFRGSSCTDESALWRPFVHCRHALVGLRLAKACGTPTAPILPRVLLISGILKHTIRKKLILER